MTCSKWENKHFFCQTSASLKIGHHQKQLECGKFDSVDHPAMFQGSCFNSIQEKVNIVSQHSESL